MRLHLKQLLFLVVVLFPWICRSAEIITVTVLDTQFRPVKVVSSEADISRFTEIWSGKKTVDPVKIRWVYLLDISTGSRSDRWRYHPEGWVQVLSMKQAKMYRIGQPQEFNELLGIPSH